jgi:hypothetical protein
LFVRVQVALENISRAPPVPKMLNCAKTIRTLSRCLLQQSYHGIFVAIPSVFTEAHEKLSDCFADSSRDAFMGSPTSLLSTGPSAARSTARAILASMGAGFITVVHSLRAVGRGLFHGLKSLFWAAGDAKDFVFHKTNVIQ